MAVDGPTFQLWRTLRSNNVPALPEAELFFDMSTRPVTVWLGVPTTYDISGKVQLLPTTGAISGIVAGNGLTGGGSSGTITLSLQSPLTLTGVNTVPTAAPGNSTDQIATTAFVASAISTLGGGTLTSVTGTNGIVSSTTGGAVTLGLDTNLVLTGAPTAATASPGTNTGQIATTAFVQSALSSFGTGTVTSVATGAGLTGGPITGSGTISLDTGTALGLLGGAPLANPVFTGTPQAPKPIATDNSTALATTSWVIDHVAAATAGVSNLTVTAPLTASASTGAVTLGLTTPLSLANGGTGVAAASSTALLTSLGATFGTVTSITAGAGLTGGTITATGTIALDSSGVTAQSYTNTNLTVDQYGRITTAASGPAGAGSSSALATDTGKMYVNLNPVPVIPASGATLQLTGIDSGVDSNTTLVIDAVGTPILRFRKAMTSIAASTNPGGALPANTVQLSLIDLQAYHGIGAIPFVTSAQIRTLTTQAWSANNYGTGMQFWTTRNNASFATAALTITGTGGIVVGGVAQDQGSGSLSAERVYAMGEDLKDLIDALDARLTAIGG